MNKIEIYTIGFTKKTAEQFFDLLKENNIDVVLDIRLNNTSQLAGFAKFPDIEYFLLELGDIKYIHDLKFAPTDIILKNYKNKVITWKDYVVQFNDLMDSREIDNYLVNNYSGLFENKNVCLLCSEDKPVQCHRSLVAARIVEMFNGRVINL